MIEVRELKKVINGKSILNIPSLFFKNGNIYGILGKNGTGKSTLLRIILDLDQPTSGKVFIEGQQNNLTDSWKVLTGAYLDEDFLIDFLLPEEYFDLLFRLRGKDQKYYEDFAIMMEKFFDNKILNQGRTISTFSKGNRQKIGIAGALIGDIKTLILDEPFSHLDEESQLELRDILKILREKNDITILLTTHDAQLVGDLFDSIVTLQDGKPTSNQSRNVRPV